MGRLHGKIAFITGGTRSIGLAIAEAFIAEGAKVIISGTKTIAEGEKIAKSIGADDYLHLDVADETQWRAAMFIIKNKYDHLDILVNNAGIDHLLLNNNPEHSTLKEWRAVHAVNLDGTFLDCKIMLPLLKQSENASIINMSSRSGLVGVPSVAAYASSKAAIINHTKTVALYCAQQNYSVRCNVILPAGILTNMWDETFGNDEKREQRINDYAATIPIKRMGTPSDVASLAIYLASDESSFVTGASFLIDGGIMAGAGSYAAPVSKL